MRKIVTMTCGIAEMIKQKLWEINKEGPRAFVKLIYRLEADWITEKVVFIASILSHCMFKEGHYPG